jgi:hypothetical protein
VNLRQLLYEIINDMVSLIKGITTQNVPKKWLIKGLHLFISERFIKGF